MGKARETGARRKTGKGKRAGAGAEKKPDAAREVQKLLREVEAGLLAGLRKGFSSAAVEGVVTDIRKRATFSKVYLETDDANVARKAAGVSRMTGIAWSSKVKAGKL